MFDFNATTDSGKVSGSWDIIIGFQHGHDDIDLSTIDANVKLPGTRHSHSSATMVSPATRAKCTWLGMDRIR